MNAVVLVVGAGPVGLTLAAELARYGVALRIIDKAQARRQIQGDRPLEQSDTEHLLADHLATFGVSVERRAELVRFTNADDKVTAVLRHADGREETQESTFLIGSDGAHSTVRHGLNMKFEGTGDSRKSEADSPRQLQPRAQRSCQPGARRLGTVDADWNAQRSFCPRLEKPRRFSSSRALDR